MAAQVPPTATYLSDDVIGLRAPMVEVAIRAGRWYDGPLSSREDIEDELHRQETIPWGRNPTIRLVAVEQATGAIVAGVVVERSASRTSRLSVTCPSGEDREVVLTRVFALVLPWLFDEVGVMTTVLQVPSDDTAMIEAAEAAGMHVVARLREHIRRDDGRVDLLHLERVNRDWGRYAS